MAAAEVPHVLFLSSVQGLIHEEIKEVPGVWRSLLENYILRAVLHSRAQLNQLPAGKRMAPLAD